MNKNILKFRILQLCLAFFIINASAQIVSSNAFLQGNFVEVGVAPCGSFGSTVNAPAGYHTRYGGPLGFIADPAKDGWDAGSPNFVGDYFLPGSPEEGFGLTVDGINYNNNQKCGTNNIPGSITTYSNTGSEVSATWIGAIGGLKITARTHVPNNAAFFVTKVTILNETEATINNVFYMRNVDPDQGVFTPGGGGSYTTNNTIVHQNPNDTDTALAGATSLLGDNFLGLGSIDARARVTHGGFSNRSARDIWNGAGFLFSTGSRTRDEAISISFNLGNLLPNQSTSFSYVYILSIDDLDIEAALAATSAVSDITCTTAILNATSTETGTGYWMVVPNNSTAPTATQIKNGTDYDSVSVVSSGSGAITANVETPFNITGLAPSTSYDIYFVSEDATPAFSTIAEANILTLGTATYYLDADEDGFGNPSESIEACYNPVSPMVPIGYVDNSDDCNDDDASVGGEPHSIFDWFGHDDQNWNNPLNWGSGESPGLVLGNATVFIHPIGDPPVIEPGQELIVSQCSEIKSVGGFGPFGSALTIRPNAVLTNNGLIDADITLESDASGSAYIGAGTGHFNDEVTVERYIPAKRAYRLLSSPVNTSGPIANNWQQDTHITGSTAGANGFDITNTGNPSMYTHNNNTYAFSAIGNTNATNIVAGNPYQLYVRGDRTIDLNNNNAPPTPTTLRATGFLDPENIGSHTVTANVPSAGFVLVGNPFQAPVDMHKVLTTNATNIWPTYYWAWDPNLSTSGAYVAIEAATGTNFYAPSAANQNLQPGQAGWVYALEAGNTEINFTQDCKSLTPETAVFKTTTKKESRGELRLTLFESGALAANQTATDGILVLFNDNGNNAFDGFDAPKLTNIDENFATSNNGTLLGIESRAIPEDTDEIQLAINTYRHSNYTMVLKGSGLQGATPYLYDAFNSVYTEIPQNGTVNYAYNVDTNIPASLDANRFIVVFGSQQALSISNLDIERLKMYPNPSNTGQFYLNIPQQMDDLEVTIYNALGAKLFYKTGFTAGQRVSIKTDFTRNHGIYFVNLSSKGITTTKKLIIN